VEDMAERKQPRYKDKDGNYISLEEYRKTRFEDLRIRVPKGHKALISEYVKGSDCKSMNQFVYYSIMEKIQHDNEAAYNEIQANIARLNESLD
jgi:hypothetical protein